jgi:hypothetical protein
MSINSFPDKFNLSRKESIFLAKKRWDANIYCGMKMENRNVTFPETLTILQGVNVPHVSLDDIGAILNMRDAWRDLLKTIDAPLNIAYLCSINNNVSRNESLEWGVLRSGAVGIAGTDYQPPVPEEKMAANGLAAILGENASETGKALDLFLWGCRSQLFWDGNKRTSLLAANKLLVETGHGLLNIDEKDIGDFNKLLSGFYSSGEGDALKQFLYDKAIEGIVYPSSPSFVH